MHTLYQLRKTFGLTQRQLATFIGKNHTQIHRIEHGERVPTNDVLLNLLQMKQAAADNPSSVSVLPSIPLSYATTWAHRAEGCRIKMIRLQKKLQQLQIKAAQHQDFLNCAGCLCCQPGLTEKQHRWLEEQVYQAKRKLQQCDAGVQAELQIKIRLLKMEAALFGHLARQVKGQMVNQ